MNEYVLGREVLAIEAIEANAVHLCRSFMDFGHAKRGRVINNALSSSEGILSLGTFDGLSMTYMVGRQANRKNSATAYGIKADSLLDFIPWQHVSIKVNTTPSMIEGNRKKKTRAHWFESYNS